MIMTFISKARQGIYKLIFSTLTIGCAVLMPPSEQAGGLIREHPQSALLSAVPLNVQTVDIRAYAQESVSVFNDGTFCGMLLQTPN